MKEVDMLKENKEFVLKIINDQEFLLMTLRNFITINVDNEIFSFCLSYLKDEYKNSDTSRKLMEYCVKTSNLEKLKKLNEYGIDVHMDHEYILNYSITNENLEVVKYCLNKKIENKKVYKEQIIYAINMNSDDIAILLYQHYPNEEKQNLINIIELDIKNKKKVKCAYKSVIAAHTKWLLKEKLNTDLKEKEIQKKVKI